ncbi:uncharacterized protein DFL_009204 [Arthrobotrys flagrans]|uniref:Uncharacterized protein n=1 Tax=Arthrobotrys flagrans TaxID=97331 RepID=A0A436ZQZ4_ARTFL|nr:hypothetical protein DFL_009204 [Arthrobotrys flagrans]
MNANANITEQSKMSAAATTVAKKQQDPKQPVVGLNIPAISNKLFWYDGVKTVKDLCAAVLQQNPILDGKRLTILMDGKRARFYDNISDRAVVTAYYRFATYRNPINKAQSAPESADIKDSSKGTTQDDNSNQFLSNDSASHSGPLVDSTISSNQDQERASATTPPQEEKITIVFKLEEMEERAEVIKITTGVIPTVDSVYRKVRSIMLEKAILKPGDKLEYHWIQAKDEPRVYDRLYEVLDKMPVYPATLDVSVTKKSPRPKKPMEPTKPTAPLLLDGLPEADFGLRTTDDAAQPPPTMEPKVPRGHLLDLLDDEMGWLSHWVVPQFTQSPHSPGPLPDDEDLLIEL